jgi:hypothetical protein
MNATKIKRAKGAGRKPKGPFADKRAVFSARIMQSTKDRLEKIAATTAQKMSVSQLVEKLLVEGLDRWETKRERPHIDGLVGVLKGEMEYLEGKYGSGLTANAAAQIGLARVFVDQLARKLPGVHSVTIRMVDEDGISAGAEATSWATDEIFEAENPNAAKAIKGGNK